jgi:hypothetical protein
MLSTLNHYQRIRKQNEKVIREVLDSNLNKKNELLLFLIKENHLFSESLPFFLPYEISLATFFGDRKRFDDELIRYSVNYSAPNSLKVLISSYVKKESLYCYGLVSK